MNLIPLVIVLIEVDWSEINKRILNTFHYKDHQVVKQLKLQKRIFLKERTFFLLWKVSAKKTMKQK